MNLYHLKSAQLTNGETVHLGTENAVLFLHGNDADVLAAALGCFRDVLLDRITDVITQPAVSDAEMLVSVLKGEKALQG